jgi:hypothetical protein
LEFGYYSDKDIPKSIALDRKPIKDYKVNSYGYRCPEFRPLPAGKKNVVVLGCSHTFGEGLDDGEVWVDQLYQKVNQSLLRFWNLGQPGASADKIVRILYGTENVLFPKIIIVCWPFWSRRERLDKYAESLMSYDDRLKHETDSTDKNNFLKNVFFVEKFAEKNDAKVFHCFAQDSYNLPNKNSYNENTIKKCWPVWSKQKSETENRKRITEPSLAKDGVHYGVEHHKKFAELVYEFLGSRLK